MRHADLHWLGMVIAGVFYVCCAVLEPYGRRFDPPAWAAFAVIVLVGSVLCFGLYFTGVALVGAGQSGNSQRHRAAGIHAALSVFWLHVPFLPMDYAGFALVVSTIFLLALPGKR